MSWSDIESAWHDLTDQILENWPELNAEHLLSSAGNRTAFATYIASTYELTVNEAMEAIESWLFRIGRPDAI